MREQVQTWLREWFASREKISKTSRENPLDIDYFAAGWLSSMEVVEFVMEIEGQFGIQFSESDLQDRRFVTISGLTDLILKHSTNAEQVR